MAASLTKTQSYAASEWEVQTTATALTVTLVTDDYLWIRQTLETTDVAVSPSLTLMEVKLLEGAGQDFTGVASVSLAPATAGTMFAGTAQIGIPVPINLQGTPSTDSITWTWTAGA